MVIGVPKEIKIMRIEYPLYHLEWKTLKDMDTQFSYILKQALEVDLTINPIT